MGDIVEPLVSDLVDPGVEEAQGREVAGCARVVKEGDDGGEGGGGGAGWVLVGWFLGKGGQRGKGGEAAYLVPPTRMSGFVLLATSSMTWKWYPCAATSGKPRPAGL